MRPLELTAFAAVLLLAVAQRSAAEQGFSVTPTRVEVAGAPSERLRFTLTLTGTEPGEVVVELQPREVAQAPDGTVRDVEAPPDLLRAVTLRPARVALTRGRPAEVTVEVVAPARRGTRVLGLAVTPVGRATAPREGAQVTLQFRYLVLVTVHAGSGAGRPALALEDVRYDPTAGLVNATLVSTDAFERQARVEAQLVGGASRRVARADVAPAARAGQPTFRVWPGSRLTVEGRLARPREGGAHVLKLWFESGGRRQEVRLELDLPAAGGVAAPRAVGAAIGLVIDGAAAVELEAPPGAARVRTAVVRNASPVAARVRVVVRQDDDPARSADSWLEVSSSEAEVPPGSTHRVAVVVRVPALTAPGSYAATLDVEVPDGAGEPLRIPVRVIVIAPTERQP